MICYLILLTCFSDIDKIRAGFGDKLGLILQYLGTCCGGIALGFSKSWKLTLVILCVAFLIMLPSIAIGARVSRNGWERDTGIWGGL